MHIGMLAAECGHHVGQQVLDGRVAAGNVELQLLRTAAACQERRIQTFKALDQRACQLVEDLSFDGQGHAPPPSLEEGAAQFGLQGGKQETYRRLREVQRFGSPGQGAELDRVAERAQLLEAIAFVVETRRGTGCGPARCCTAVCPSRHGDTPGTWEGCGIPNQRDILTNRMTCIETFALSNIHPAA